MQLPEWQVTLHYTVCMTPYTSAGKRLHTLPSHPTLDEPQAGFWLKMLTDRERKEHIKKNRKSSSHKYRTGWEETETEVELGQNSQKLK